MPVVGKDDKFPLYCLKFVCVCVCENQNLTQYEWKWCCMVWRINKIQLAMCSHKYNCTSPCPQSHKMSSILQCHWFCLCDFFFPKAKSLQCWCLLISLLKAHTTACQRNFLICSSIGCWASLPPLKTDRRCCEIETFYHILNKSTRKHWKHWKY